MVRTPKSPDKEKLGMQGGSNAWSSLRGGPGRILKEGEAELEKV